MYEQCDGTIVHGLTMWGDEIKDESRYEKMNEYETIVFKLKDWESYNGDIVDVDVKGHWVWVFEYTNLHTGQVLDSETLEEWTDIYNELMEAHKWNGRDLSYTGLPDNERLSGYNGFTHHYDEAESTNRALSACFGGE